MNVAFKECFLKDLKNVKSAYALRGVRMIIRQAEAAETPEDIGDIVKLSASDKYFGIILGNYRIGLKMDNRAVVFVRILHHRDVMRFYQ